MKKSKKILIICSLVLLLVIITGCTADQPEIAVLDMERLLKESKRAEELRNQLEEVSKSLEEDYELNEQELDEENKEEELDNIYMEFLNSKQELEGQLNEEISNILREISESENFEIVLYKKYVKYGGLDITTEVIQKLDDKYAKGGKTDNGNGE